MTELHMLQGKPGSTPLPVQMPTLKVPPLSREQLVTALDGVFQKETSAIYQLQGLIQELANSDLDARMRERMAELFRAASNLNQALSRILIPQT